MAIVFTASNLLVLPFWFLMITLPHWRGTQRILQSPLVLVPLPVLYAVLALPQLETMGRALLNPQLDEIAGLLGQPAIAAVGWIHYLAFDLFVGRYSYLDSRKRRINAWLMAPVLLLTLLLGPLGLLLYLGLRAFSKEPHEAVSVASP
jgi:hypothetical protein